MAFFGLTQLGYQNPIGDKMIVNLRGEPPSPDSYNNTSGKLSPSFQGQEETLRNEDVSKGKQLPSYSADEHHRSHECYKETVKRTQPTRSPNQLYIIPVTENQQYGWMVSKRPEPWTRIQSFPRQISEMTKFVNEMSMIDREFSLF
ncbi:sperm microtubule inner protein 11 [Anableps anableps]